MVDILLAVLMHGFCLQLIYLNMFYVDCIRFYMIRLENITSVLTKIIIMFGRKIPTSLGGSF